MSKTEPIIIHNRRGEALVVDADFLAEQTLYFRPDADKHNLKLAVRSLALKVRDMRIAQRLYFKSRAQDDLKRAKVLEAEVDKMLQPFFSILGKV